MEASRGSSHRPRRAGAPRTREPATQERPARACGGGCWWPASGRWPPRRSRIIALLDTSNDDAEQQAPATPATAPRRSSARWRAQERRLDALERRLDDAAPDGRREQARRAACRRPRTTPPRRPRTRRPQRGPQRARGPGRGARGRRRRDSTTERLSRSPWTATRWRRQTQEGRPSGRPSSAACLDQIGVDLTGAERPGRRDHSRPPLPTVPRLDSARRGPASGLAAGHLQGPIMSVTQARTTSFPWSDH